MKRTSDVTEMSEKCNLKLVLYSIEREVLGSVFVRKFPLTCYYKDIYFFEMIKPHEVQKISCFNKRL